MNWRLFVPEALTCLWESSSTAWIVVCACLNRRFPLLQTGGFTVQEYSGISEKSLQPLWRDAGPGDLRTEPEGFRPELDMGSIQRIPADDPLRFWENPCRISFRKIPWWPFARLPSRPRTGWFHHRDRLLHPCKMPHPRYWKGILPKSIWKKPLHTTQWHGSGSCIKSRCRSKTKHLKSVIGASPLFSV